MSSKGYETIVESAKKRIKYINNYVKVARKVKKIIHHVCKEAKVYIFGSVVKGKRTASSDIDLLVVLPFSPSLEIRSQLMAEVFMKFPDAPIELHITDDRGYKNWYAKFLNEKELVEV
jgi:predicted nucleotidyltransferase